MIIAPAATAESGRTDASRTVVVIGAGFSGTMTAVHLMRGAARPLRVVLVEERARPGRGLAYHIRDDSMLLNVPAGNMSAFPDDPAHFTGFCRAIDPALNAGSFVSRRIYGDYLEHTLAEADATSSGWCERIRARAEFVRPSDGGFTVGLSDGRSLHAAAVVLALGHQAARQPDGMAGIADYGISIANPWDFAAMDRIDPGASVAVLGTGHTAIDALFRLTSLSEERKVFLISRRGLLPAGHGHGSQVAPASNVPPGTGFPDDLMRIPASARSLVRAVRQEIVRRVGAGDDWRDVINEMRPHLPAIWHRLPVPERRRLLTRVIPYWDVHRHRLAPLAHRRLRAMLETGQTEVIAGRVQHHAPGGTGIALDIRQRGTGRTRVIEVGAVVNCTGPEYDITRLQGALFTQLRDEGYVQPDALGIGMEVDPAYRPVGRAGAPTPGLFYVGPMLRANYWEAIAVPELRRHALDAALHVLSTLDD